MGSPSERRTCQRGCSLQGIPGKGIVGCGSAYYLVHSEMLSRFLPKGLWGMIYWYTLYPFHEKIFFGMLKKMAKAIE